MKTPILENPAKSLDKLLKRIGKSINNDAAKPSGTARLQEEAMKLLPKIEAFADTCRMQMLEPLLPYDQIEEAKRNAEAAAVDSQRLETAIELLGERRAEQIERERVADKLHRHQIAKDRRDKVARLITDRFPDLQAEYLALIKEIMASNDLVDRCNLDLPDGAAPLERPEGFARGFKDSNGYEYLDSYRSLRITQSMIPSADDAEGAAWPPVPNYQTFILQHGKGFYQRDVISFWNRNRG